MTVEFADIDWAGRPVRIEHEWLGRERSDQPLMVFLHEGLGSVAMWRDFPARLVEALGWRGLVYSRPGYGRSTPRAAEEAWGLDFMHRQAEQVLPALFRALGIDTERDPPWLLGHSDGGSITLLHAAAFPGRVAGAIVLAPHIFVEDLSIKNIAKAREAYLSRNDGPLPSSSTPSGGGSGVSPAQGARSSDLRARLAKYHDDPDSAFWGWNDIWLHPPFRQWTIERELPAITCPLLAVQGVDDEYGTLAQIRGIAAQAPQTELLELPDCGHSPHRDQPERLVEAVRAFVHRQCSRTAG